MSNHRPFQWALLPFVMSVAAAWVDPIAGAEPGPEAARLAVFKADNTNYFALGLGLPAAPAASGPRDVVVMVNTSAVQVGPFRTEELATLRGLLAGLGPQDRVQILAVDLNAIPMTAGFVAPKGPEIDEALAKLERREPLGSTDMEKAMTALAASFSGGTNPRAAVYIGDGTSKANILSPATLDGLVKGLTDKRIPLTAYATGPMLDLQLLGALAGHTGGLLVEANQTTAAQAGAKLAVAAHAEVAWPKQVTWPPDFTVFPKRMPPLRSDRDSVVIGTFKGAGPFDVRMTADAAAGATSSLTWKVAAGDSSEDNSYLPKLVKMAAPAGGIDLPLVSSATLKEAAKAIGGSATGLGRLAIEAFEAGDLGNAERFAREAIAQNIQSDAAQHVLTAVQKRKASGAKPGAGAAGADLNLTGPKEPPVPPAPAEGSLVETVERQQKITTQVISAEVTDTINRARKAMSTDPNGVIQGLKEGLENVRRVPELDPDVRAQLVTRLQTALREADRRRIEYEHARQQQQELMAQAKERQLLTENLLRKQDKLRQMMDRFASLMDEGRYKMAEEQVALEARKIDPDNSTLVAASMWSHNTGANEDIKTVVAERWRKMVDALYQVEKSHVPFPDEPPVVYPDPEVWRQLTARRVEKYRSMDLGANNERERKIAEALKSSTQLEFTDESFQNVIDYLKDFHKIEIQFDQKALEEVGFATDKQVTINLKGVTLRSALRLLLRAEGLTYMIRDEVLLITTPDEAANKLVTKVYPVGDLVIPPMSMGMGGGMGGMGGGMGGMGGGMGGMGGGMGGMGGGMGGMGGGMGGMGGGMGRGGGMFNLPALNNFLNNNLNNNGGQNNVLQGAGFREFSVKDDLNLTPDSAPLATPSSAKATKPEAKPQSKPAAAAPARRIELSIPKGADVEAAWDKYLSTHDESPAAVRQTVRSLWQEKKHDQIIGVIKAALRHRQAQPWMYEALSLAMQAAGRSPEEIERAVMSAVEFAQNPVELMFIGLYLERLGLEKRALDLFRQVARREPMLPEPYVQGLRLAEKLNDLDGIQWAAVGILSQAWPKDQQDVWEKGLRVATANLEKLKADKRTEEAKKFEAALDKAVIRDCVLVVTWTGDGDVDLVVAEPAGTTCSLRNPRTTSGGMLIGDCRNQVGQDNSGARSEVYVCPQGFSGKYKALVRRVWGDVTANKVKVDVYAHFLTGQDTRVTKSISLEKDRAAIEFDLADGRRTESLQERQIANTASGYLALRQQILALQMATQVDPEAMRSLAVARAAYKPGGGGVYNPASGTNPDEMPLAVMPSPAAGYQPVIITLSEGAMLGAVAVISADRRYVRVSPSPMFSGISEVNTFNTTSGASGTSNGGTGGQGFGGLGGGTGSGGGF